MVVFMWRISDVIGIAHHFFLQRKVRRYLCIDFPESGNQLVPASSLADSSMDVVDQIDQLAMLVVHGSIPDAEFRFPLQQFHRNLNPPDSARNVIVK